MWRYLVVIRTLVKGYKNNFESSTDLERYVKVTKKTKTCIKHYSNFIFTPKK